jgi:signal peptidase
MENSNDQSKVLGYIKTGLFYTAIGILVLYIVIGAFFPKQTVKVFGFKPYVVITASMEPEIMVNDLIIVKNPKVDELEVDDIITFEADINFDGTKEIVTHYIYSIEEINGEFRIRTHPYFENSNDSFPDYWVLSEDDILGEYMFKIPKVGAVVEFIKSPFGMAAMVVNLGVIVGIVYLIKKSSN